MYGFFLDKNSHRLIAALVTASTIATLAFVWLVIAAHRWERPAGRTITKADGNDNPK